MPALAPVPSAPAPRLDPREDASNRRHYLEVLRLLAPGAVEGATPSERLGRIVTIVSSELCWDVCSIYLVDEEREALVLAASHGLAERAVGATRIPLAEGLVGAAAREETPIFLEEASADPRYKYLPETGEERFPSLAAVPFGRDGVVFGVLTVQTASPYAFTTADRHFLEILAAQTGQAVDVALSLRTLERRRVRAMTGTPAAPGLAVARVHVAASSPREVEFTAHGFRGLEFERALVRRALAGALSEIDGMMKSLGGPSSPASQIFAAHRMILEDPSFLAKVDGNIERRSESAPRAVAFVMDEYIARFSALENVILREKSQDLRDLRDLLLRLMGESTSPGPADVGNEEPMVIVAHELTPQQTVRLDPTRVLAIVTETGGEYSHAAIVARALSLPAVVGVSGLIEHLKPGDHLLVDGHGGFVIVNPDPEEAHEYRARAVGMRERQELVRAAIADSPDTGLGVRLDATIGLPFEIEAARSMQTRAVGLLRTEFFYMQQSSWPDEEVQARFYERVFRAFPDEPVTVRLLDIGGDKFPSYLAIEREENPHLGSRSVRLLLDRPEILRSQLSAIHLAALRSGTTPRILVPMVTQAWELDAVRETVAAVTGTHYPVGMMIEVPSVLFHARPLMDHADFAAVGTNDLAQYLLAVDRNNARIRHLHHPFHPGLVGALARLAEDLAGTGKDFGVCGEMAADPASALVLWALGYRRLSVTPSRLPDLLYLSRSVQDGRLPGLRAAILASAEATESERMVRQFVRECAPLLRPV